MQLHILGGLDLAVATGEPVQDVTRQTRLVLACLAVAGAKGLSRAELCGLFWPDRPTAQSSQQPAPEPGCDPEGALR